MQLPIAPDAPGPTKALPLIYPSRSQTSTSSSRNYSKSTIEEEGQTGEILNKFNNALPAASGGNEAPESLAKNRVNRKAYLSSTTPAMTLQPRRPKTRHKLSPHEPLSVDHAPPSNGTLRRFSNVPAPAPSVSSGRTGSQKLSTAANMKSQITAPQPRSPGPSVGSEKIRRSPSFFEDESLSKDSDEASKNETSDDFLFRELVAHTVAEYDVELPLCCECAPLYYSHLQLSLEDVDEQIEELENFISTFPTTEELERLSIGFEKDIKEVTTQLKELETEYDRLVIESALQQKEANLCEKRTLQLQRLKDDYWNRYTRYKHEHVWLQDWRGTVQARLSQKTKYLERLRTSCGLNEVFHISYEGHYATINGLRLGLRSPTLKSSVDWDEISAAFGFLAFLLIKLGTAIGHNWKKSKMWCPRLDGSFTSMFSPSDTSNHLPLFVDKEGSWALLRFRDQSSFDKGFEAFLKCFFEVSSHAFQRDPTFGLPYPVTIDESSKSLHVGGKPIVSSRSDPEQWTKMVKKVAINIKSLLKWLVHAGNVK